MTEENKSTGRGREPDTYSIPEAGKMAGLARNASYSAARIGQIPLISFGGKKRVPGVKWRRILAEGSDLREAK